jgi:hypothetical protein
MAITEQDQRRVLGAAKALFQERKSVSLDDLTEYIRSVLNIQVETTDVEESLTRLFERPGGNLPAIELHQAMAFRRSALAYWLGQYAILVIESTYIAEVAEGEKESNTRTNVYLFFGVAGNEPQTGKFLGVARSTKGILEHLKAQGIEVGGWHPLDSEQWKTFIPHSPEKITELAKTFGKSLYSGRYDSQQQTAIVFAL